MTGPVTCMPPTDSPWEPLWRYALAVGTSGKRLHTELVANGIPVMIVAGEPQVRRAEIEAFLALRQREAEARAQVKAISSSPRRAAPAATLQDRLDRQAEELERLRSQLDMLLTGRRRLEASTGAANET